jgi:hypothetical protein
MSETGKHGMNGERRRKGKEDNDFAILVTTQLLTLHDAPMVVQR